MAQMPEIIVLRKKKETKTTIEYEEVKPKTNADLIRAMTDEELAERFLEWVACDDCPVGQKKCKREWANCKDAALEWLKQEGE